MLLLLAACAPPAPVDSATAESDCVAPPDPCPDGVVGTAAAGLEMLPAVAVPHGPVALAVGDLADTGTSQLYVGTNTTVTRLDGEGWSVATEIWTQPDDGTAVFPLVADLTGDGALDLAIGLPGSDDGSGQVLIFPGPVTGPVSWDSPHLELKGGGGLGFEPATGDFDGDGQLDLLVNGHGFAMIKLGPFAADTPFDTAVDTLLDGPADAPALYAGVANLDGDGIADVVYALVGDTSCDAPGHGMGAASGPFGPGQPELPRLTADPGHAFIPAYNDAAGSFRGAPPLAADADGDGLDELLVYALSTEYYVLSPLVAALYPSPVGTRDPVHFGLAEASLADGTTGTGIGLDALGDLDNDGMADLFTGGAILAGPLIDLPPPDRETCTVAYDYVLANQATSAAASWLGDLDADGENDLAIAGGGEEAEGAVQLLLSSARD